MTRNPDETPMQHDRRLRAEKLAARLEAQKSDPVHRAGKYTERERQRLAEVDTACDQAEAEVARIARRITELRPLTASEVTATIGPGGQPRYHTGPRDPAKAAAARQEIGDLEAELAVARDRLQNAIRIRNRERKLIEGQRRNRRIKASYRAQPKAPKAATKPDPFATLRGWLGGWS